MQPDHLCRLDECLREFIREVELNAEVEIVVVPDARLNAGGPQGAGNPEVAIRADRIQLFVPTNGYFAGRAVRHEVLHVKRFHVDGVPKLTLADVQNWDRGFFDALGSLDNAIEHVAIVQMELQLHPERREHWEAVMQDVCQGLEDVPERERALAVCMHWTFLRSVLPESPQAAVVRRFAANHGLFEDAERFADLFSVADSKEEVVRLLVQTFPQVPWHRAALEYLNSSTGRRQIEIA